MTSPVEEELKRPLLERLGLAYFERRGTPERVDDAAHILDEEEQGQLRAIERGAITRAFIAGAISAAISGAVEWWADGVYGERGTDPSVVLYWLLLGTVTGAATAVELGFLYWDALRSARNLADAAHLRLFVDGVPPTPRRVAYALSRAALELPNPTDSHVLDPHREANKTLLAVWALVYKLKVGATNFLVKALIRRAAGRVAVRSWLPFVAVPITGAWNAWVAWRVMREARIRVIGPSAARAFLESIEPRLRASRPEVREACVRAVASAIVRTQDLHPNLEVLLVELLEDEHDDIDVSARFIDVLDALAEDERRLPLEVFSYALALDGRLHRREVRMWKELMAHVGRAGDKHALREITREFRAGLPLDEGKLARAVGA
jgi:hypothetical protein